MKTLDEVEPRTPVSAANTPGDADATYVIASPGSYYLTDDLATTSGLYAIRIDAPSVTLDLMGFNIDGGAMTEPVSAGLLVANGATGVEVRNGSFSNWTAFGAGGDPGTQVRLRDLRFRACNPATSIAAGRIDDCVSTGGTAGFFAGPGAVIEGCEVSGATTGPGIGVSSDSEVRRCAVRDVTGHGIRTLADGSLIAENTVRNSSDAGVYMQSGIDSTIRDNDIVGCGTGIRIDFTGSFSVSGNTVHGNGQNYDFPSGGGGVQGGRIDLVLSEIPQTISWPCRVTLAGSLTGVAGQNGITIASDDVTIDLAGHSLIGVAGALSGIEAAGVYNNLRVLNGSVRDWDGDGIDLRSDSFGGSSHRVEKCSISNSGGRGIRAGLRSFVIECTSEGSGGTGIEVDEESVVERSAATNGLTTGMLVRSHSIVRECIFRENAGFGVSTGGNVVVERCTAWMNDSSGIVSTNGTLIRGCSSSLNGGSGINASGSVIKNNMCRSNTEAGIRLYGNGSLVEGNNLYLNPIGVLGIINALENTIVRNTIRDSTTPIDAPASNEVGTMQASPVGAGPWDNIVP